MRLRQVCAAILAAVAVLSVGVTAASASSVTPGSYVPRAGAWRNVGDGGCLDDSAQFHLRLYPCNGSSYQGWTPQAYAGTTWVYLVNQQSGRYCVDTNGSQVYTTYCEPNGSVRTQLWQVDVGRAPNGVSYSYLHSFEYPTFCITGDGGVPYGGGRLLTLKGCNNRYDQYWYAP